MQIMTIHSRIEVLTRLGACLLVACLSLALLVATAPAAIARDALDDILDEIDPTAPPPSPPPGGGGGGAGGGLVQLLRIAPPAYADGISDLAGPGRRSGRDVSNIVLMQSGPIFSEKNASDMVWQWGQFVDHDIDLTESDAAEPAPIDVPDNDPIFDPNDDIDFNRSVFDPATGTDPSNPRQQINQITGLIDATNVYGSDPVRADILRTNDGTGKLKTSAGNLLPFNIYGLPNAGGDNRTDLFLAGDIRANEQAALTSMHTLWVREHNQIADRLAQRNKDLTGDQIYSTARVVVEAEMQSITYNEFLPVLLGAGTIPPYTGYQPSVNPDISNVFSTAAYRLGHSMLSSVLLRLDSHGNEIPEGHLPLREAFFAPTVITDEGGIEPLLHGLTKQVMQRIDSKVVEDVRSFLFGQQPPGTTGLDLAALNIQRGRDHGLPDYNAFRIAFGLVPVSSFGEISTDPAVAAALFQAYGNVNDVDAWVGMLAEDHVSSDVLVGPLIRAALVDQFTRLRDGDPSYYQNILSDRAQRAVERNTLFEVMARNGDFIKGQLPKNVFIAP